VIEMDMSVSHIESETLKFYKCKKCGKEFIAKALHTSCRAGFDEKEKTLVYLFGREVRSKKRRSVTITDFKPYFYIREKDKDKVNNVNKEPTELKGFFGEKVLKISCESDRAMASLLAEISEKNKENRSNLSEHIITFEADIRADRRVLLDLDIRGGVRVPDKKNVLLSEVSPILVAPNIRVCYFDIEVDERVCAPKFPDFKDPIAPLIVVTFYDNFTDTYFTFTWHRKVLPAKLCRKFKGRISGRDHKWKVFIFKNEVEMLENVINFFKIQDPDVITGWNIEKFDIPYLHARCRILGLEVDGISPLRKVYIKQYTEYFNEVKIGGRVVVDLLKMYRRFSYSAKFLRRFSLDLVGNFEFKIGKLEVHGVGETWDKNFVKSLKYNLYDVELCVEIDKKRGIIAQLDAERRAFGCKFKDVVAPSRFLDMIFLKRAREEGVVLPSRRKREKTHYKGAITFDPVPGRHFNVAVADLSSFYPSIIIGGNFSPEMKVRDRKIIKKLDQFHKFSHLLVPILGKFPEISYTRSATRVWFRNSRDGITRKVLLPLIDRRMEMKAMMKKHRPVGKCEECKTEVECNEKFKMYYEEQKIYKKPINATYGVFAYSSFRLYDEDIPPSITGSCREIIKFTKEFFESKRIVSRLKKKYPNIKLDREIKVLYGDTDSTFIRVPAGFRKPDGGDAFKVVNFLVENVNKAYKIFLASRFYVKEKDMMVKIAFEQFYTSFLQNKKKKYAFRRVWNEGYWVDEFRQVGMEAIKQDTPKISREVQKRFLELVHLNIDLDAILRGLKKIVKRIKKMEYNISDIATPKNLVANIEKYSLDTSSKKQTKGIPIHVRAALTSNAYLGTNFKTGDKILLIPLKPRVLTFELNGEKKTLRIVRGKTDVFGFTDESQIPKEFIKTLDTEEIVRKCIKSVMTPVFEALDISWETFYRGQRKITEWVK